MKKLLFILTLLSSSQAVGQTHSFHTVVVKPQFVIKPIDVSQKQLFDRWSAIITPSSIKKLAASASSINQQLKKDPQNTDLLNLSRDAVTSQFPNLSGMSVEDAVMLMMMLISQDAEKDMQGMLNDMNQTRLQKNATRKAKDEMDDASDAMKLKLQQMEEQREKALETISNIMKEQGAVRDSIISNIK